MIYSEKFPCVSLNDFIKRFVGKHDIIRLWTKSTDGGYKLVNSDIDNVCISNKICEDDCEFSKYKNCNVIELKSIVCGNYYQEAINIVIDTNTYRILKV